MSHALTHVSTSISSGSAAHRPFVPVRLVARLDLARRFTRRADQRHHIVQLVGSSSLSRRIPPVCNVIFLILVPHLSPTYQHAEAKHSVCISTCRSINFGVSCLGNVNGTNQYANLGDGFGVREQGNYDGGNGVLRWNYGDTTFGTCKESIQGDNHFRWFIQNGSSAFTGAIFIAASMEESAALGHKIQRDGYNRGRDYLVGNATINQTTSYKGFVWSTKLDWIPAGVLLNATSDGINHPDVALPGQPVQDGRVALLTVTQLQEPTNLTSQNAAIPSILPLSTLLIAIPFSIIPLAITTFVL